ncbi:hypothetical protein EUGRSUZ_E02015 [Eucalyptus grandis]|uniref:Uncharacterized protein n=2 Tax=Eucalyptus grandis TaxID=71139 RepID=A0ACC3KWP7_EUCGR|nr:hypothetical protein EUGRSUZ_E02015 [Eucalyptus grandis]
MRNSHFYLLVFFFFFEREFTCVEVRAQSSANGNKRIFTCKKLFLPLIKRIVYVSVIKRHRRVACSTHCSRRVEVLSYPSY